MLIRLFPVSSFSFWRMNSFKSALGLFKILALTALMILPAFGIIQILMSLAVDHYQPPPIDQALQRSGMWALRFLLLTLLLSPLRVITGFNFFHEIRRFVGLVVFAYALFHISIFVLQQVNIGHSPFYELLLHPFLVLGGMAFLILCALSLTSTDEAIKQLSFQVWKRLHLLVYPAVILAFFHAAFAEYLNASPIFELFGVLVFLLGLKLATILHMREYMVITSRFLFILVGISVALTALSEALWYHVIADFSMKEVLWMNIIPRYAPRPAFFVAFIGLIFPLLAKLDLKKQPSEHILSALK